MVGSQVTIDAPSPAGYIGKGDIGVMMSNIGARIYESASKLSSDFGGPRAF